MVLHHISLKEENIQRTGQFFFGYSREVAAALYWTGLIGITKSSNWLAWRSAICSKSSERV